MDKNLPVLVVDDFHHERNMAKSLLRHIGFKNTEGTDSGYEALRKMRTERIGFVVCNLDMQEPMTGREFLKQMRQDRYLAKVPVVTIVREQSIADQIMGLRLKNTISVAKPFTAPKMERAIMFMCGLLSMTAL